MKLIIRPVNKMGLPYRVLTLALLVVTFASAAVTSDRSLQCVARLNTAPGRDCFAAGELSMGTEHVYHYDIDHESPEDDILITVSGGNVDLVVGTGAAGSMNPATVVTHRALLRTRDQFESAQKTIPIAVRSPISISSYALDVIPQSSPFQLWPEDEDALRDLLAGVEGEEASTCCMQPGTCSKLKDWLGEGKPAVGICYQDGNLCSKEGRLLALDLSHQELGCLGVPKPLQRLTALQSLDLSGTGLSVHVGDLVSLVRSLPRLESVKAAHNNLEGPLDCALLSPGLIELDLAGNRLYGHVPPCFLSSPTLRSLRLSHNSIKGALPEPTEGCVLHTLQLDHMGLQGPLPDLSGASQLAVVDLSHNQLTPPKVGITWPPMLRTLRLAGNAVGEVELPVRTMHALEEEEETRQAGTRKELETQRNDAIAKAFGKQNLEHEMRLHQAIEQYSPAACGSSSSAEMGSKKVGLIQTSLWGAVAAASALFMVVFSCFTLLGTLAYLNISRSDAAMAAQNEEASTARPLSPIVEETSSAEPVLSSAEGDKVESASSSYSDLAPATTADEQAALHRLRLLRRKQTASSDDELAALPLSTRAEVARKISSKSDASDGLHPDLTEDEGDGLRIRAWVKDTTAKKDD